MKKLILISSLLMIGAANAQSAEHNFTLNYNVDSQHSLCLWDKELGMGATVVGNGQSGESYQDIGAGRSLTTQFYLQGPNSGSVACYPGGTDLGYMTYTINSDATAAKITSSSSSSSLTFNPASSDAADNIVVNYDYTK